MQFSRFITGAIPAFAWFNHLGAAFAHPFYSIFFVHPLSNIQADLKLSILRWTGSEPDLV
jgi:hypothetical protein